MAKSKPKKVLKAAGVAPEDPPKLLHIILLIAYGYLTVFTPNMNTYDSNGPKFVALALLNLVTFAFLFSRKDMKTKPGWYYGFFGNAIGMAYSLLMFFSLLSFVKAINLTESVLHFAKIFSVFSAAYLVSVLVIAERRGLLYLSAAMTLLLLYDSISVFSDIQDWIEGNIANINKIKSVYSNKNILAAAVFVKIPFALWLMFFQKKLWRILGMVTTPIAMLAVFFMSARAFYLGLFIMTFLLVVFFAVRYYQSRERSHLVNLATVVSMLLAALLTFSVIESNYFPKPGGKSRTSVGARMATINDPGGGNRLNGWKRSIRVLAENPVLGVGLGNWKVATLKEENQTSENFIYQYKAHNDFLEIPTESGIFAGICFLAIFGFLFWKFLRLFMKNNSPEGLAWLFLPAVGLFAYSFDAFFNFPQDRPEIQSLFALYVGTGIALTSLAFAGKGDKREENDFVEAVALPVPFLNRMFKGNEDQPGVIRSVSPVARVATIIAFLAVQTVSAWVLVQYFNSLKLQRIIKQEILRGKLTSPADKFLSGFPAIPNLNGEAEPIAVQKARYLLNEKRYQEAISLLKDDRSSPYDSRKEYFMSMAYMELKMPDSALYYSQKVYELKPNNFKNISIMTNLMREKGMVAEAEAILDGYMEKHPRNVEALRYASGFYDRAGKLDKALAAIDTAFVLDPKDTIVIRLKTYLDRKFVTSKYKETFDAALAAFREKRYGESVRLFSQILDEKSDYLEAREYRAFSYFYLRDYAKSIADIRNLVENGVTRSNLYNLLGVNLYNSGNREDACTWFKAAMDQGDKDGTTNFNRYCKKTVTQPQFPLPTKL
ncbi:MAG: O-Antigen ligase [Bacteroidetes bacterium ADurb.Bin123]|nr:MAG: O-Antigen ligase [Bacteroidetes bacterium ADurb.Bin123]